jgi:hypothetical protein
LVRPKIADVAWTRNERAGEWSNLEPQEAAFTHFGIGVNVLKRGQPNGVYHSVHRKLQEEGSGERLRLQAEAIEERGKREDLERKLGAFTLNRRLVG